MKIEDILASDALFQNRNDLIHEPLNGGLSNETHIVICDGVKYVVKINFKQNEYLNLSRKSELEAQSKAAAMGIAPKVLGDMNQSKYSISEFVVGHLMEQDEIVDKNNINKIASVLREIHSITGIERTNSIYDMIGGYVKGINKFDVKLPEGYHDALKKTDEIRYRRSLDKLNNNKYCHNDILANNLLYDGSNIIVIDWELSGIGDPYMDLASLPYSNNFTKEQDRLLLEGYFGYYDDEMQLNLNDLRYVGMVREVVWALFYAGLNTKSINHDYDYYGAACYVMDRLNNGHLCCWG